MRTAPAEFPEERQFVYFSEKQDRQISLSSTEMRQKIEVELAEGAGRDDRISAHRDGHVHDLPGEFCCYVLVGEGFACSAAFHFVGPVYQFRTSCPEQVIHARRVFNIVKYFHLRYPRQHASVIGRDLYCGKVVDDALRDALKAYMIAEDFDDILYFYRPGAMQRSNKLIDFPAQIRIFSDGIIGDFRSVVTCGTRREKWLPSVSAAAILRAESTWARASFIVWAADAPQHDQSSSSFNPIP